ncbi:pyridoxal phosphate-dependent transferase [Podospora didyma]|uniref:Pyridoxal phosphate-dependent transferase n=1 Tax=Podospora didyma TaxID=330526 RepID=A0AAE0K5Z4_9PEZI|nr:pyridoxal phosphate-dependent transferase [Podospora didyma]
MGGIQDTHPEYLATDRLDELRATEYGYLDAQDHVYLDYTGAGLAAKAQHRAHEERLAESVFGNPHSVNPTSEAATEAVEKARARVLAHFNASPDEYAVIFTPNATGAARLVGEAYPFRRGKRFVLTADNHNSINGIREYARHGRSKTVYVRTAPNNPNLRVNSADVVTALPERKSLRNRLSSLFSPSCTSSTSSSSSGDDEKTSSFSPLGKPGRNGLFAYPAQSNFTGVRHPLSWIPLAQARGYDVLLDAAAYLPTATLDLSPTSSIKPDFVTLSFYKLFGYPTGVGCLIAKPSALSRLSRPWFSGGTIQAVAVGLPWHKMAADPSARFEDGTLNFLSIPDVAFGLDWLTNTITMPLLEKRVRCLTGYFLTRLLSLQHSDGSPMVRIYGPKDCKMRGSTIAFNFLDASGKIVDERLVALESAAARISLRTGCFCNPGAGEGAFELTTNNLRGLFQMRAGQIKLDDHDRLGIPSVGAVRVSFGAASNAADVERFFGFAEKTYKDRVTVSDGLAPRDGC